MRRMVEKISKHMIIILAVIALAVPSPVLAQDVAPTAEPPVVTEVVTDVPTEVATESATEAPATAETEVPTEVATEAPTEGVVTEAPEGILEATEFASPTIEPIDPDAILEVVDAAADADVVLVDENGEPVVMASAETEALLTENPDPWIVRGDITYRFLADCSAYPDDAFNDCTESTTPVQAAINFANPGETVYLGAGTFIEEIDITKDLVLQGMAGTIIQSPAIIDSDFTVSGTARKSIISVTNSANVIIDNVTVDGLKNAAPNYSFIGIGYYNASGTISNSIIMNIMNSTLSGTQHGVGIYAYNDDGITRTLNVSNNTIVDFQKGGMVFGGDGLSVNVNNNTVTGAGDTAVTAQNGIQIGYNATGSVTNNTVKNIGYEGAGWSATGILLYQAGGTTTISGNSVVNSQNGINANVSAMIAEKNSIDASDYGITSDTSMYDSSWNLVGYAPGTNSIIRNNIIKNSYLGFYGTDPSIVLRDNKFLNNTYGAYNINETLADARYNYWGCDLGADPSLLSPCNVAFNFNTTPWLMDPDADGVYDSSDGTGGYVDNCPVVYNPDQADVDGDGVGNACDPISYISQMDSDVDGIKDNVDNCLTTPNADQKDTDKDGIGDACDNTPNGKVNPLLVPVTGAGGAFSTFNCSAETILRLPSSDFVIASSDFCNMKGELAEQIEDTLPEELPAGNNYQFGMNLTVLDSLNPVKYVADPGRLTFSFAVPEDMLDKTFTVFFWDETLKNGVGDWVELPAYAEEDDGTPVITSLHPEEVSEARMTLEGVKLTELDHVEFVTNFPGLFILAIK